MILYNCSFIIFGRDMYCLSLNMQLLGDVLPSWFLYTHRYHGKVSWRYDCKSVIPPKNPKHPNLTDLNPLWAGDTFPSCLPSVVETKELLRMLKRVVQPSPGFFGIVGYPKTRMWRGGEWSNIVLLDFPWEWTWNQRSPGGLRIFFLLEKVISRSHFF